MRKPIIGFVKGNLLLLAAVGRHAPNLHPAGAFGVKVDVAPIRRVLRPIVQALGRREAPFRTTGGRDGVDVELVAALTAESKHLSVRRPAVPVGWPHWCDELGYAAGDRQRVDQGLPSP